MVKYLKTTAPEGTTPADETFSGEFTGTYNVTLLRKWTEAGVLKPLKTLIPIDETWIKSIERIDTNPERVKKVTLAEIVTNPVMLVQNGPQEAFLIDGSHRLKWLIEKGGAEFIALIYSWEDAQKARIRFYSREKESDPWIELPDKQVAEMDWGHFPQHS